MKQNKRQKKYKKMKAGFSLFELLFVITLIISLAMIAVNKKRSIEATAAIASMMTDLDKAITHFNNITAIERPDLKALFKGGFCVLKDTDDDGKSPTNDDEIKCSGTGDDIKTAAGFKQHFGLLSVSEGDGVQVGRDLDCDNEVKLAVGSKYTGTVVEYKGCTYRKPKILKYNDYSVLRSFVKD